MIAKAAEAPRLPFLAAGGGTIDWSCRYMAKQITSHADVECRGWRAERKAAALHLLMQVHDWMAHEPVLTSGNIGFEKAYAMAPTAAKPCRCSRQESS